MKSAKFNSKVNLLIVFLFFQIVRFVFENFLILYYLLHIIFWRDYMLFNIGDLVTRKSHNHDMVFKIINIMDKKVILKGLNIRLLADAFIDDLSLCEGCDKDYIEGDTDLLNRMSSFRNLDRDEYFYLPGKILHIDADKDYLDRCMKLYKEMNILSYGIILKEDDVYKDIEKYLIDVRPDILVITGHDAFYDKNDTNYTDMDNYKNSSNFAKAVMAARKYEKDHEKLVIISGACQSNYEELIRAGSNFASSPKRINIHALDPAIVASSVSLSNKNSPIDLINILSKTKYGKDGVGGIITNGTMYVGYPR